MPQVEFDEVRFPTDVSFGSSGGPVFKTQVFEGYRGFEKRNIDWASPLMEFDVGYGIKTTEQMAAVAAFFNAREGRLRGFRYRNWANYQLLNDNIAVGDGRNNRIPMIRTYGFPATQTYKRLYKIVQGSVTGVTIGGESLTEGIDYSIDYNSGEIITASNRIVGEGIPIKAATLEFDEPVRFDVDSIQVVMEQFNNNSLGRLPLVGIRDTFTAGTVPGPDAALATRATANDPYFGSVRLMLKFDDATDLSTTTDYARYSETVTVVSPAMLITDTTASGAGAVNFGTNGYLSISSSDRFDLSDTSVPFCVELFARRPDGLIGEATQLMWGKWDNPSDKSYMLYYAPSQQRLIFIVSADGTAETLVLNYPWTEAGLEDWQHISVERLSTGVYVMRINGLIVQTAGGPAAFNNNNAIPLTVGGFVTPAVGQGSFQGDMDSVRFTYARSRYGLSSDILVPQADYPV